MKVGLFLTVLLISSCYSSNLKFEGPVTVSGLSSGAFMANQMHVAFSDTIKGAAIFAGGPYYCAQGQMMTALTTCMAVGGVNISTLKSKMDGYDKSGSIDHESNLSGSNVFIFDGTKDSTVNPKVGMAGGDLYQQVGANLKTEYSMAAGHGMPTVSTGVSCSSTMSPYINNCGYNGAFVALNHLYGGQLVEGSTYDKSRIQKITQQAATGSSLGSTAYAYVPQGCAAGGCAVHAVFHGCQQTTDDISMQYVETTGYNEVAEANGIIMVYPQAKKSMFLPSNPNGCWDWWGYTNGNYATKSGVQMKEAMRLIQGLKAGTLEMTPVYDEVSEVLKVSQ